MELKVRENDNLVLTRIAEATRRIILDQWVRLFAMENDGINSDEAEEEMGGE